MKGKPSKPRYANAEGRKRQPKPLDLTPESAGKGWARAIMGIVLTTLLPTVLLWWACGRK